MKKDTRAAKKGSTVFPLSGVIVCGDCGAAMIRKNYTKKDGSRDTFYVCSKHRANTKVCSTHTISAVEAETPVLRALRLHTSAVLDVEKALASASSMAYRQDGVRKLTARLEAKQDEIKRYSDFRLSLYESYREGVIQKSDFTNFKENYDIKIAEAEAAALLLKEEIEKMAAGEVESHDWIGKFHAYSDIVVLNRKAVVELVEKVAIYECGCVEVTFRYYNEFARLFNTVKGAGRDEKPRRCSPMHPGVA